MIPLVTDQQRNFNALRMILKREIRRAKSRKQNSKFLHRKLHHLRPRSSLGRQKIDSVGNEKQSRTSKFSIRINKNNYWKSDKQPSTTQSKSLKFIKRRYLTTFERNARISDRRHRKAWTILIPAQE